MAQKKTCSAIARHVWAVVPSGRLSMPWLLLLPLVRVLKSPCSICAILCLRLASSCCRPVLGARSRSRSCDSHTPLCAVKWLVLCLFYF